MHLIGDFIGKINEAERGNNAQVLARLTFDPRKRNQVPAPAIYVTEASNLGHRRIRIRCGREFRAEQQFRYAHRLIEKNLLLISFALAPSQDRLNRDDGWFEFKRALQKKR